MTPHRLPIPPDNEIAKYREALQAQFQVLQAAADDVHRALDDASNAYTAVADHMHEGGAVSDLGSLIDPIPLRANLGEALEHLERTRHRAQCLLFRLLCAEGKSMADIARVWGISRQLVSRLVNEPL